MFNRQPENQTHELDETITNLISELAGLESGAEAYSAAAESLKVLMEARNADKAARKRPQIDPNQILAVAGTLLSIGLILGFEKANVITSKSLSFVPKLKIGN